MKYINKIKGLKIIENPDYCFSNNWLNILEVDEKLYGISKKKIIEKFKKFKIETKSLWYPNHLQRNLKFMKHLILKMLNINLKDVYAYQAVIRCLKGSIKDYFVIRKKI